MTTTKALWQKEISKLHKRLDPLPSAHGARHPCIMECGKQTRGERIICRSCVRKAKRKLAKVEYKQRKAQKHT